GQNLFALTGARAGAASRIAIDPVVAADSKKLATAGPTEGILGSAGVLALGALRDAHVAGGNQRTLGDEAIRTGASVGQAARAANTTKIVEPARVSSLSALRDTATGVSQEDELAKLASFQRVSQAALKFTATVNDMLDTMLQTL